MYYDFYQLRENPFNVTADPDFFYASKTHADAISNLLFGIEQRKGMMVVTGEVGTGKTTLCRKLLLEAPDNTKFALILNPKFSEIQLLQMIVNDLGIQTKQRSRFRLINLLNEFLINETNKGNNVILIIDEAQQLGIEQLEQIRLLSNLETEKEKLLQIILVGQPELRDKLRMPQLRQLTQRVSVAFNLKQLEKNDVDEYVHHRILKAAIPTGIEEHPTFTQRAIDSIFHFTNGSPRTINLLCDRALMAGFVAEKRSIDDDIIENCAKEVMYFEHNI